jgi:hypothetical protein
MFWHKATSSVKGIAMELWRFLLFSSLEYVGMIVLMFAVFRFSFRGFIPHTVFICVLLSFISHYFRENGLVNYSTLVQVVLFVICIYLLYRLHWYYSIVMGVTGFQTYSTVQACIVLVLSRMGLISIDKMSYSNFDGLLLVAVQLIVMFVISVLFHIKGWGFTFIPTGSIARVKFTQINVSILFLSMLSVLFVGASFYFYGQNQMHLFVFLSVIQLIILVGLIYYSLRKERMDNG